MHGYFLYLFILIFFNFRYDCECCASYYNALGLNEAEKQERIQQVSRHRGYEPTPRTPERYWDMEFPSRERKNGETSFSNSPLFKNKTKKLLSNKINWAAISKHGKKKVTKK